MKDVDSYTVVSATTPHGLSVEVNGKINEGWVPLGGVSFYKPNNPYLDCYHQAMMKYKED